jgi:hypothetical protein
VPQTTTATFADVRTLLCWLPLRTQYEWWAADTQIMVWLQCNQLHAPLRVHISLRVVAREEMCTWRVPRNPTLHVPLFWHIHSVGARMCLPLFS